MATYKAGQAPWETNQTLPEGSFLAGQAPWEVEQPKKDGFVKSLYKSIAEPVANIVARPIQLGQTLLGAKPLEGTYAGLDINVPQNTRDVVKDIGRGAETIALGIGGGGTVGAVKTGLKGLLKEGIKQEAKVGLKSGALVGFGQGLEKASEEPPEKAFETVFSSTALGGVLGTVTGGILGGATPLVAKGVSGIKKFANVGELQSKLADGYRKILNPTARQLKADKRFGNDSFEFLAKEAQDLPLQVNKDGRVVADDAIEMLRQKYTAEATAYKPIIRNSGKYIDIDEAIAKAKRQARQEFDGSDLTRAEKQIEDEVNAFLANSPTDVNVTPSGKRMVSLDRADDIKTYSWGRGKGWGTPEAEVWNDTNNLIGHALKDAIEKELPNAPIKAMNKRLGQWKNAIDMLERRNAQVSGSGGKLSKYIIKSVGTSIGAGLGQETGASDNITGAGAGFLTATAIASIMANPNIRLAVVRQLLKNLNKAGRQDMIREAEQILQEQANKYLLPSAGQSSYVEPAINLPRSVRETNLGLDELRGQSMPKNLQQQAPIVPPTIAPTINSNIEKNQIKATIANKPADNNKTSSLINKTVPEKKGFIKSLVDKYKNLPNKQGGFAKFGSDVKISVSPESVSKKLSFEDKEIINRILNRKTLGTEIATSDFLKQLGIDKLEPELRDRFLREALDLSNKLSSSKSKSSITPIRGQGGKFNGSVSKLK